MDDAFDFLRAIGQSTKEALAKVEAGASEAGIGIFLAIRVHDSGSMTMIGTEYIPLEPVPGRRRQSIECQSIECQERWLIGSELERASHLFLLILAEWRSVRPSGFCVLNRECGGVMTRAHLQSGTLMT